MLSHDGRYFVVSYGSGHPPEALCLLSVISLEKIPYYDIAPTGITGSQIYTYTFPPD